MSVVLGDGLTGGFDQRRLELEQTFLSVQRERVALAESFLRLGVECRQTGIKMLMVRSLRLRRAIECANEVYPHDGESIACQNPDALHLSGRT